MEILQQIPHYGFWFLVVLTALVFIHELGHFAVARFVGVRVEVLVIGVVEPDTAAADAGLQTLDRVLSLNGAAVDEYGDIETIVQLNLDKPLAISVDRAGKKLELTAHPKLIQDTDLFGDTVRMAQL